MSLKPGPVTPGTINVIPAPVPIPDTAHVWLINAQIMVDHKRAHIADVRGSIRAVEGERIDALDVICRDCRRPMEDVADEPCAEKINNRHLIGGDQSVRVKRKKPKPVTPAGNGRTGAEALGTCPNCKQPMNNHKGRVDRVGIEAVIRKEI